MIKRAHNIFDYYAICNERYDDEDVCIDSNKYYGANFILKRYSDYTNKINADIEHGFYINDLSNLDDYRKNENKVILVPSWQRAELLSKHLKDKIIIPIGPIINYAKSIYGDYALSATKKELGKTLLVFPLHNIENMRHEAEKNNFIKYVNRIAEKFNYDTILVSIYFIDLERGCHFCYEKEGWKIVSSGRRMNYDFLDCEKTLLKLSNATVVQGFSSAIGYSLEVGVPSNLYHESLEADFDGTPGKSLLGPMEMMSEFEKTFFEFNEYIGESQLKFADYWFGSDCKCSQNELLDILNFCEGIDAEMDMRDIECVINRKKFDGIRNRLIRVLKQN